MPRRIADDIPLPRPLRCRIECLHSDGPQPQTMTATFIGYGISG